MISSFAGDLGPVFQAMLANATRICEAKYGVLCDCRWRTFQAVPRKALAGACLAAYLGRRHSAIARDRASWSRRSVKTRPPHKSPT